MKKLRAIKLLCLVLCMAMMLPMMFACGEKDDDSGNADATTTEGTQDSSEPAVENDTTTEAPTTTEPPPTEPEPTMPPIDPSLPYYEQVDAEFEFYGFSGGEDAFADGEEATMKKMQIKGTGNTYAEISDQLEDVPFSYAYSANFNDYTENFWDYSVRASFRDDIELKEGDIIAGVVWLRCNTPDSPAAIRFAIKTPTDNWASEGRTNLSYENYIENTEWHKMYFYGYVLFDEPSSSAVGFEFFSGYEIGGYDIGGMYVKHYPNTAENNAAVLNLPMY